MSVPPSSADHAPAGAHGSAATPPRADLIGGLLWLALGVAITIGSWRMSRLRAQHINPYTAPGLVPGLLGLAMLLLGALMALRGWRAGARWRAPAAIAVQAAPSARTPRAIYLRIATVIGLCALFSIGLVGHGLPFWAAATIFVVVSIPVLQTPQRQAAGRRLSLRDVLIALAIGLGAGGMITLVFQELFLVHLP